MQITLTPTQATKTILALHALYDGKGDADIDALLANLEKVVASRAQETYCLCGALIPIEHVGRPKEYCSEKCRQQAYRERRKARLHSPSRVER